MESNLHMRNLGSDLAATQFSNCCTLKKSEGDDDDGDIDIAPAA